MLVRNLLPHEVIDAAPLVDGDPDPVQGRLLWHVYTPYAVALGAWSDDGLEGAATLQCLGSTCRITLLLAEAPAVYAALMAAVRAHAAEQDCTTLLVHAAQGDEVFWERHGFAAHGALMRYSDGRFTKASREDVVHLEPQHRLGALHLDRRATGEERATLLMEHAYLGLVCSSDGLVHGAAWPMLGEGLIVANDPSVGMEMLRWHFPLCTYVLLHAGNAVHDDLTELGHTVETIGTRMVHGTVPGLRPELIFSEPFAPLLLQGSPSKM